MMLTQLPLAGPDDKAGFWRQARAALASGAAPDDVCFALPDDGPDLFAAAPAALAETARGGDEAAGRTGTPLGKLVDGMLLHAAPERFARAYRLLWRQVREPALASIASDPEVAIAADMGKSVRRDMHKMTAFVRFRARSAVDGGTHYVAWFEPEHHIVRAIAPFFVGRFTGMRWSILTPRCSAHWDCETLSFSDGAQRSDAPDEDPLEDVWRTYYGSIFNPARLKVKAMTAQMPKKYWHNLPEAGLIAPLVRDALARNADMLAAAPSEPRRARRPGAAAHALLPRPPQTEPAAPLQPGGEAGPVSLSACTRCSLHACATQAVAGEGPAGARLMFVGEQPGDQEDLAGRPFVGPAGQLLDKALERAEIDRAACYLTNAVKHFKFEPRGKRRIHKSPNRQEIDQCRWWLDLERARVRPKVIVALGVSAVRGITGRQEVLSHVRSRPIALEDDTQMVATVHPAFLLRLTDDAQKRTEWKRFLSDLRLARDLAA